ncbi:MAG TPA: glycoside hydrolase family 15 protein [Stellaceae bacterium]|nr:glycoside hydrolase family 15 protein [Stellaceae bacterium]
MDAIGNESGQALSDAPGHPGIRPTWTSSAKDMVGSSIGPSRLWFTLGFGIVNEVYYPRVDIPQIRDLGFIVADDRGFWVEVKRVADYSVRVIGAGVPAAEITHVHERYRLRLRITPDPERDALVIETTLDGDSDLRLYVLVAPHLGATGQGNCAVVERYRGRRILGADQGPFAMALAAVDSDQRDALGAASAGYVGFSDGWQDFARNGRLTWTYPSAGPGNVALIGALPSAAVIALAFGSSREAAATLAISALLEPFDSILDRQIAEWHDWQRRASERFVLAMEIPTLLREQFLVSGTVLHAHLDKTYPGAMVASLSIPWGDSGEERGGYHLVWPRDLVECAGALLAVGADDEARDTLRYLIATQNEDGHWYQNQWLGGRPYWSGVQLDETAFPVLLAAALHKSSALGGIETGDMVRRALSFIAMAGPATAQDRWEENAGVNAFTLAVCISALVSGSAFLPSRASDWALELADFWNANIERWTAVTGTSLCSGLGVSGYFIRTAPLRVLLDHEALHDRVPVRNRNDLGDLSADRQIGTDFLQLVRFGLRDADDPLVRDTLKVVDHYLKVDTPSGPVWRRYSGDGYGEHEDGRPFDGVGRGRPWPLLTGERGHYELVAGRDPLPYLEAMAATASPGGMIPEQIWDDDPIPSRRLELGRPTGSAMPLAWAHAEFIKLMISRQLGHPVDRPWATWLRYRGRRCAARYAFWFLHAPITSIPSGASLAIGVPAPALIHWGVDGWTEIAEQRTEDSGLGFCVAALTTAKLLPGQSVQFTLRWEESGEWLGRDIHLVVRPPEDGETSMP